MDQITQDNLKRTWDSDKFRELLLYIATKSAQDPTFGMTKLNKILFLSDFWSYATKGKAITWVNYQNLPKGPAPKPLVPVRDELVTEGAARIDIAQYFGYPQKRLVALGEPDLSRFTAEEILLVDRVMGLLEKNNATEVNLISHRVSRGWQITSEGDLIPYESVFISSDPPGQADIKRGQQIAELYSLN